MELSIKYWGNPDKPLLVLLHGFLGCAEDWDIFIPQLPNFYCAAVDLPGHGASTFNESSRLTNFASVADTIVKQLGRRSFFLLGYSMGGRIALDIMRRYPKQVPKLICISGSPGFEDPMLAHARYEKDKKLLANCEKQAFLHKWYRQNLFYGIPEDDKYAQLFARRLCGNFVEMQKGLDIMSVGKQPNMWPWLKCTQQSILYICGRMDTKYFAVAQRLQKETSVKISIFEECSHMPHFQKPLIFAQLVNNYYAHSKT
ncbi:alpha/beta fold hydrolase [Candidatus Uabimicrobium amorphum]|uniref:Putative2-succinyl-6-hydroxy-2,4-cyclohexadiene-1-carboxylatesynthase n=1 Tax=Uabimicrobium amorphum TaxID=2596890 RepID=A0A5S9F1W7_UABAM|nr:alpha/beta fold hydrolase [Candidatus Uabimicrobium amorphum]BBM83047.1 putative2-succinyl-6-hydroxy-2,4-cyclohexadiene-1-carboxylatesynthase [Candidatus Uabimicrobium amorphum]